MADDVFDASPHVSHNAKDRTLGNQWMGVIASMNMHVSKLFHTERGAYGFFGGDSIFSLSELSRVRRVRGGCSSGGREF